jgi:hypothetical protein
LNYTRFTPPGLADRGARPARHLHARRRDWVDDAEDLPLTYEFRYIENATAAADPEAAAAEGVEGTEVYTGLAPELHLINT